MSEQDVNSLIGESEETACAEHARRRDPGGGTDRAHRSLCLPVRARLDQRGTAGGLFTAMTIAGLIAHKNGHSYTALGNAVIGGISSAMGAVFILLAVGALIGTWNMAGTIPTIVDYGLRLLNPNWFYPLIVIICAITGCSHRQLLDDRRHPRGRVRRDGAGHGTLAGDRGRRGDLRRLLRRQDVAALRDDHPGAKPGRWRDDCPAYSCHDRDNRSRYLLSLVIFFGISLTTDVAASAAERRGGPGDVLNGVQHLPICLAPLVLLIVFSIINIPAFLSIFLTAIFSACRSLTQHDLVIRFAGDPDLSEPLALIKGIYAAMATGFVSTTGIEAIDSLFSARRDERDVDHGLADPGRARLRRDHGAGRISRQADSVLAKAKSGGALAATVIFTAFGLNIIAADQYIAIVLPSRMFRLEFKRRGYKPTVLCESSRTRHRHLRAHSVEHLWRLSHGCGHFDVCVLPVLLLQYHQSHLVPHIRIHGLPHGEVRARRGAPGR